MSSVNPFDTALQQQQPQAPRKESELWQSRSVEWPLPTVLTASQYTKLMHQAGQKTTATTSQYPLSTPEIVVAHHGWMITVVHVLANPSLRLVSRWNVRRSAGLVEPWMVLPYSNSRIVGVFGDALVSASNGELYQIQDGAVNTIIGTGESFLTGVPRSAVQEADVDSVQKGLSEDSYVTQVTWDTMHTTKSTQILLGTNKGEIYWMDLAEKKPPMLMHKLTAPVTGLAWQRLRTGMLVLVVTQDQGVTQLHTLESPHNTKIHFVFENSNAHQVLAWPAGEGRLVVHEDTLVLPTQLGLLVARMDRDRTSSKILHHHMLELPHIQAVAITPHHYCIWQSDKLLFINRISETVVQELPGDPGDLLVDVRRPDQVWLCQGRSLRHVSSVHEDRDAWKYTLFKGLDTNDEALLDQAKVLCGSNTLQKQVVLAMRALHYWEGGKPQEAAKSWAACPPTLAPLVDTALRLLDDDASLVTYLQERLTTAPDSMRSTIWGAWLLEWKLGRQTSQLDDSLLSRKGVDSRTIWELLMSFDVTAEECASRLTLQDGTTIQCALAMSNVPTALQLLDNADFSQVEHLYVQHAFDLWSRAPTLACTSFLNRYSDGLNPLNILATLMRYERAGQDSSPSADYNVNIGASSYEEGGMELKLQDASAFVYDSSVTCRYLAGCIALGCQHSAIFSYLLNLYSQMVDEEPLYKFLQEFVSSTEEEFPLDLSSALRTILETGRHFRSAIVVYRGLGLRIQAVELALQVDPPLARELAQDCADIGMRQRLWLLIAKHAAQDGGSDVVARVVGVLRECGPDVLSMEDVLQFLPDFCEIDDMKDEIGQALTSYSNEIDKYLRIMQEQDVLSDDLRSDIAQLRHLQLRVPTSAKCALTNQPVLQDPFYAFPSGYVVLESALRERVVPWLTVSQQRRLEELDRLLLTGSNNRLRLERDGLLAGECPLTGSIMIDSIDAPFS